MERPGFKAIEKKIKIQVLLEYKRRRCLWDITHPEYHNQAVRNEELGQILKLWHKIDPTATIESIKMKILNMRTNYIRQRKKVENSITADGEEVFKPTLWYYKYLDFLTSHSAIKHKPKPKDGESNTDTDSEDMSDNTNTPSQPSSLSRESILEKDVNEPTPKAKSVTKEKLLNKIDNAQEEINRQYKVDSSINKIHEAIASENENDSRSQDTMDESAAAFGRSVGLQLCKITDMQRWIAEKLISDVLFQAKLSHLSTTSKVTINENKSIVKTEPELNTSEVTEPDHIMFYVKEEPESDLHCENVLQAEADQKDETDLLGESVPVFEDIKIEENETENAVKFLQMY